MSTYVPCCPNTTSENQSPNLKRHATVLFSAFAVVLLLYGHFDELQFMVAIWDRMPEYEHGYFLPLVTLFLIHKKRTQLRTIPFSGSWSGLGMVLAGLTLALLGKLAVLPALVQYAFILSLAGIALAVMGWVAFRIIAIPLFFLAFMIPLPSILHQGLSTQLQLISSHLGVAVVRLCGIEVYLEGNIIDLGHYKLQVAQACDGLRYLFPLASIAFVVAYLFQGPFWKKAVLFFSCAPITAIMNSFRIGMVAVLVEYWGISMAEGFMHDFEGWVLYGVCLAILGLEVALLSQIGTMYVPYPSSVGAPVRRSGSVPAPALAVLVLLMAFSWMTQVRATRTAIIPHRDAFSEFPMVLGNWHGNSRQLSAEVLKTLRPDDYLLADYTDGRGHGINLHIAYFVSQQTGAAVHSPRYCIPGSGWFIREQALLNTDVNGHPLTFNRVVIEKGAVTQVVYYWFRQQGRNINDAYQAKWYLFQDSLMRQRADGALVRIVATAKPHEIIENTDRRLVAFARLIMPYVPQYVPD